MQFKLTVLKFNNSYIVRNTENVLLTYKWCLRNPCLYNKRPILNYPKIQCNVVIHHIANLFVCHISYIKWVICIDFRLLSLLKLIWHVWFSRYRISSTVTRCISGPIASWLTLPNIDRRPNRTKGWKTVDIAYAIVFLDKSHKILRILGLKTL